MKRYLIALVALAICAGAWAGPGNVWNTTLDTFVIYDPDATETMDAVAPVKLNLDLWSNLAYLPVTCTNGSGSTSAGSGSGGFIDQATSAADDDVVQIGTGLDWTPANSIYFEARAKVSDPTNTAWFIGMTDAVLESATLPIVCNTGGMTTAATDCVGFFSDPDDLTAKIRCENVKNNTDGTVKTLTTAPDNAYHVYRIEIDASGNAEWWLDGVCVGGTTTAITTTSALCGYVGFENREAAVNHCYVDYIRIWAKKR